MPRIETPSLIALLLHVRRHCDECRSQLLLPFGAGQLLRPWIGACVTRHARAQERDCGSILLIVYSAFSHGVVGGIWHQIAAGDLFKVALVDVAPLAAVITILTFASRQLGFARADEITVVFYGSKKSLASGLPIATLLFAGHVGLVVIPLVLFHQIQLMVASLALHYAARGATASRPLPGATSAWTFDIIAAIPHRRD